MMKNTFSLIFFAAAVATSGALPAATGGDPMLSLSEWTPPAVSHRIDPLHPVSQRIQGIEGTATVILIVNEEGLPEEVTIFDASQLPFGSALKQAVERWRFEPARFGPMPIPSRVRLSATFRLQGAVISMSSADHVAAHMGKPLAPPRDEYRVASPRDLDEVPRALHRVMPRIPPEALPLTETVEVHIDFILSPEGEVRVPAIVSATDTEMAFYLAGPAIEAMRQWQFTPPVSRGARVYAHLTQVITFQP